jgi:MFS transporter, NNP family, nitrate/nitrite transporter
MGGLVSDRFGNRRFVMLAYMLGIAVGFALMGIMNSKWPLVIAVAITVGCSFFVQGAEGATFGIIPSIKRRLTGQISGMAGAYGNVGAVFYLFVFMFVTPSQFFMIIAAGAFISWLVCLIWLKEPEGGFGDEYVISSVDRAIARETSERKQTRDQLASALKGSQRVELIDRGDGVMLTARFSSVQDLKALVQQFEQKGLLVK